jgi:endoglycosylceramidase
MDGRRARRFVVALLLFLLVACSGGGDDGPGTDDEADGDPGSIELPRLHAVRGERPGIFDEDGRQVVLRGVNLNGLADYARNNPDLDPTIPITDETWDQIAAEGFDVVRLLVSWSGLEPERGRIDDDYVADIRAAVRAAAERGLYTVVDMHQDAWGPYVATPDGVSCPAGREPSNGWDGAPEWATPSPAEVDSCRPAGGEAKPGSELVTEAWHRFYTDADGIQSRLVTVWEHLATALADEPSVAGYDLLNEPGYGRDEAAPAGLLDPFPLLGDYYARAIDAIRRGEAAAGIEPRPIFFEHAVNGNPPPADFSDDPGLVFAPHVYGGSIVSFLTVDQHWDLVLTLAQQWQASIWVGEYGWWDDPAADPELLDRVGRFAVREDGGPGDAAGAQQASFVPAGSAWWQWNNGCGDPHQITDPGAPAPESVRQYRVTSCRGGDAHDEGVVPGWRQILTRPAVRFAPGWITTLASDGAARTLDVQATDADPGAEAELWVPGEAEPALGGVGVADVDARRARNGWQITVTICEPTYQITVRPSPDVPPDRCSA